MFLYKYDEENLIIKGGTSNLSFLKNYKKKLLIISKYSKFCDLISKKKFLLTNITFNLLHLLNPTTQKAFKKMYKRSKKDDYRKKIEEMIGGSHKRKSSNNIDNYDTNIVDYDTNIVDGTNIINDDDDDVANVDINESSSDINSNDKNDKPNINKLHIQRWNPNSNRIKGIRKLFRRLIKLIYN